MRKLLILLFLAAGVLPLAAQKEILAYAKRKTLLQSGLIYFRNSQYDLAERATKEYCTRYKGDPVCEWRLALVDLFRFGHIQNGSRTPELDDLNYGNEMALIATGLKNVEIKLREGKDVEFYSYVKAGLLGIRGLFEKGKGHPKTALETAEEYFPVISGSSYQDALCLAGIFEYEIAKRSLLWRIGARWRGFPTDRRHALELIKKSVENNDGIFADDIRFVMFNILTDEKLKEKDKEEAKRIFGITAKEMFAKLTAKYPLNNSLVSYREKHLTKTVP